MVSGTPTGDHVPAVCLRSHFYSSVRAEDRLGWGQMTCHDQRSVILFESNLERRSSIRFTSAEAIDRLPEMVQRLHQTCPKNYRTPQEERGSQKTQHLLVGPPRDKARDWAGNCRQTSQLGQGHSDSLLNRHLLLRVSYVTIWQKLQE